MESLVSRWSSAFITSVMTFSNYNVLHSCTDIHSSVIYLVWNPSPLLRYGVSTRNKAWLLLFWSVNDFKAAPCWFVQGSHQDSFGWNFCFVAFKIRTEQMLVWSFYFSARQSVFIGDRQMTFNYSDRSFSEIFSSLCHRRGVIRSWYHPGQRVRVTAAFQTF